MNSEFADEIANKCINHYHSLGKKGKPIVGKEWTLLSSVVMSLNGETTVLAMATGTKCLGHNGMSPRGDLVNDSHAEVLARRCFLRYLYDQILKFQKSGNSDIIIGCNEKNQYEMNPDIKFHFYSSHVPCGDASIIPKTGVKRKHEKIDYQTVKRKFKTQTDLSDKVLCGDTMIKYKDNCNRVLSLDVKNSQKLKSESSGCNQAENSNEETSIEIVKDSNVKISDLFDKSVSMLNDDHFPIRNLLVPNDTTNKDVISFGERVEELEDSIGELVDIHRTGAKCIKGEDGKLPGALFHKVGAVRTKPGRGDPTLSVSCSDKIARWIVCGLQGALLSLLLSRPVRLSSVIIGGGGQYSEEVMRRALLARTGSLNSVILLRSSVVFPHSRYSTGPSARPCPSAILWALVTHKPLEVCVGGRRQGATKRCCDNGRLLICKFELLRTFLTASNNINYQGMTYKTLKALAEQYNHTWEQAKCALKVWTSKPSQFEDFKMDS